MDQGFAGDTQGFAPSSVTRSLHGGELPRSPAPGMPQAVHVTGRSAAVDQARIQHIQGIRSLLMLPTQFEFIGFMGGGALAWIGEKLNWGRVTTVVRALLSAPGEALRNTQLREILHLPARFMESVANHANSTRDAKAAGETARWAKSAEGSAASLAAAAANAEIYIAEKTSGIRNSISAAASRAETTGMAKAVHGWLDAVRSHRASAASVRHTEALGKAVSAVTTEGSGFFSRVFNFVTRATPPTVDVGELKPIMSGLEAAQGIAGAAEKIKHLKDLAAELGTIRESGALKGEAARRAGVVAGHLTKAVSNASSLELLENAAGGGLKTMLGVAMKSAGRVPLFHAMVGAGVVAGIGVTLLASRAESKQAKAAYKELLADLGGKVDSPFAQAVKAAQQSKNKWHSVKTGLELAGGFAGDAMWIMPGGGGAAMMGGMIMPQICRGLVPDNALLAGYVALKHADEGAQNLNTQERAQLITQLIAAMPYVAQHGGKHNNLAVALAHEIATRNMNTREIVNLLGNETAFSALATQVNVKLKSAAPATGKSAADSNPPMAVNKDAAKPDGAVVGRVEHHGTLNISEKLRA